MGDGGFCLHPEYHDAKYEQEKNQEAMDDLMTMCKKVHGRFKFHLEPEFGYP